MQKLPAITRIVSLGADRRLTLRYAILEGEMPCGLIRYGIQITEAGSADNIVVRDLTMHDAAIRKLCRALVRNAVTPIGLLDVLADWL